MGSVMEKYVPSQVCFSELTLCTRVRCHTKVKYCAPESSVSRKSGQHLSCKVVLRLKLWRFIKYAFNLQVSKDFLG